MPIFCHAQRCGALAGSTPADSFRQQSSRPPEPFTEAYAGSAYIARCAGILLKKRKGASVLSRLRYGRAPPTGTRSRLWNRRSRRRRTSRAPNGGAKKAEAQGETGAESGRPPDVRAPRRSEADRRTRAEDGCPGLGVGRKRQAGTACRPFILICDAAVNDTRGEIIPLTLGFAPAHAV